MLRFALNLASRHHGVYYGVEDMRVGLAMFGNGEYLDNGTVAAALEVGRITSDVASASTGIEGRRWRRGVTDMTEVLRATGNVFAEGQDDAPSWGPRTASGPTRVARPVRQRR